MTLNVCQAGHTTHESRLVETDYGQWNIWDWARYMDFPNYCTGQDEVSKSIDVTGWWEKPDTDHMMEILDIPGRVARVLDFGSHIGWFSVLAAERGALVDAFDADPENVRLLRLNCERRGVAAAVAVRTTWVADIAPIPDIEVRLVKVDLESREMDALNLTRHLWQQGKVDFGLWELSPIFNDTYPDLVDEIASYGYRWYILKGEERWYIEGKDLTFPQENAWCERV